jgi:hypothetical protein
MGRKLTTYLDVMKWVTLNNLQNRKSAPIGRVMVRSNNNAFILYFDKASEKTINIADAIMRGE